MLAAIMVASAGFGPSVQRLSTLSRTLQMTEPELGSLELSEPEIDLPPSPPAFSVTELPGVTEPMGFFDPAGFSKDASEGRIRFYREVELKHGRISMLAALGFPISEQFHPLFGGDVDVPSYIAFQETPLQAFWPAVVIVISIVEVFSVFSFNSPFGGELFSIRTDFESGDLGFDPLRLKPESAEELREMQTKELNNGRLAMIAIAGMVGQELWTGSKLW
uniref:Uncharacterized protein n=1 Tax=Haptolina brevifila TaxID=156173 RepID=A0A7S2MJE1_9EUKA